MKEFPNKKTAKNWGFARNWACEAGFMRGTTKVAKNLWISAGGWRRQWERYDFAGREGI